MNKSILISCLCVALAAGCGKSNTDSTVGNTTAAPSPVAQELDKVKQDSKQLATDVKDYTYAEKDAFVKKMQDVKDKLDSDYAELSAKVGRASDQAKAEAKPKLDALRADSVELSAEIDSAKNATEATWSDVKTSAQKAMDSTEQAFKDARDWIDKEIGSTSPSPQSAAPSDTSSSSGAPSSSSTTSAASTPSSEPSSPSTTSSPSPVYSPPTSTSLPATNPPSTS